MIKNYLLLGLTLLTFGASAQILSDDVPATVSHTRIHAISSPEYLPQRAVGVTSTVLPCGGGVDTLIASGACSYEWASDSAGMNIVSSIDTLITGPLTNDTTFYLSTFEADLENLAALPAQASTFSGNVRGYYFVAPMDMFITGLYIPQDASSDLQNIAVLLFDNQTAPPAYSLSTNAFTNLGTWTNYPANDTIIVCFPIDSGDVVGIYGQRGNVNSYGNGSTGTVIDGVSVPLYRSGMQFPLASTPMQDVWSEPGSTNISRVQFFYDVTPTTTTQPVFVNVPMPSVTSVDAAICAGDSILLEGAYQTAAGSYVDAYFNVDGCDSTVTTNLIVNPLPTVSMIGDTACVQDGMVPLNGTPAGGIFSGTGVTGSNFNAATGAGSYTLTYSYTDNEGCSNTADAIMVVEDCAAIGELSLEGIRVFPNPVNNEMHVDLPAVYGQAVIKLYDANGKLIIDQHIQAGVAVISTAALSEGMYILEVRVDDKTNNYKVIKE